MRALEHLPCEGRLGQRRLGGGSPTSTNTGGEGTEDRAVPLGAVAVPIPFSHWAVPSFWGAPAGPQIHPTWGPREGADGKATVTPLLSIATAASVSPGQGTRLSPDPAPLRIHPEGSAQLPGSSGCTLVVPYVLLQCQRCGQGHRSGFAVALASGSPKTINHPSITSLGQSAEI